MSVLVIALVVGIFVHSKNIHGSLKKNCLLGALFNLGNMNRNSNRMLNLWKILFGVQKL